MSSPSTPTPANPQKLLALKPREVVRILEKAGFIMVRQRGSHIHMKHPDQPGRWVTIPYHRRDLARKTLASIIRQAGLTVEEFLKLR